MPPFHAGTPGARRAAGWAAGDAAWGPKEGVPCEQSLFSPLCPCLHPPRLGGCRQSCLMRAGSCCRRLSGGKRPHGLTRCGLTARPCYTMGCGGEAGGRGIAGTGAPLCRTPSPHGSRRGPRCMLVAWRGDDDTGGLPAPGSQTGVRRPGRLLCFLRLSAGFSVRML